MFENKVLGNQAPSSQLFDPYERLRREQEQKESRASNFKAKKSTMNSDQGTTLPMVKPSLMRTRKTSSRVREFGNNSVL